jgi:hypothetical protein
MAQPITTAAGNSRANWMRLSMRTSDPNALSREEDFAGGDGRSGWSEGIAIGASYTPPEGKPQVAALRYPGFPVEVGGVVELHAPFFTEGRTRGLVWCCEAGNPG